MNKEKLRAYLMSRAIELGREREVLLSSLEKRPLDEMKEDYRKDMICAHNCFKEIDHILIMLDAGEFE